MLTLQRQRRVSRARSPSPDNCLQEWSGFVARKLTNPANALPGPYPRLESCRGNPFPIEVGRQASENADSELRRRGEQRSGSRNAPTSAVLVRIVDRRLLAGALSRIFRGQRRAPLWPRRSQVPLGHLGKRIAIVLGLIGDGIVVVDFVNGLLADLAGEGPHISSAQGRLAQRFEEGAESVQHELEPLLGDLRLFAPERKDDLAAAHDGSVSADHGRTDPIPLPFGQRPVLASHAKNKNPSW